MRPVKIVQSLSKLDPDSGIIGTMESRRFYDCSTKPGRSGAPHGAIAGICVICHMPMTYLNDYWTYPDVMRPFYYLHTIDDAPACAYAYELLRGPKV